LSAKGFGDRVNAAVVSCLGLGYSPFASGTVGTVGAMAIVWAVLPLTDTVSFGLLMVLLAAVGMVVGVALGGWAERHYGRKDPSPFVLDELVGYFVTLYRFGDSVPGWKELVVAFFAFRVFDVIKPPPGRQCERLPRGWGIMLDDVFAGVYANLLVWGIRTWWPLT